jgi:hypothetical protein
MMVSQSSAIEAWHALLARPSPDALRELLAEDAVFHSPIVHTPQEGRDRVMAYLLAAFSVLNNETFRYVREVVGERDAVLEFTCELEGIHVNGVDLIRWRDDGRIVDFKVMVRPLKAVNAVHARMKEMLERMERGPTP